MITASMQNLAHLQKPHWIAVAFAAAFIPFLVFLAVSCANAQSGPRATTVQMSSVPENPQSNAAAGQAQPITFSDALQRARAELVTTAQNLPVFPA
jgi:hypothetical protein